jgi:DNA phosphorothioation-associated putative methyltransferase
MITVTVEPEIYARLVGGIALGKRLPDALYLHVDAVHQLGLPARRIIEQAAQLAGSNVEWNVVKFSLNEPKVSLLWYPTFFEEGFPALARAISIDLASGSTSSRTYNSEHAPILHRKETMLPPGHSAIAEAAALTREAESLGLFEGAREIGHRVAWEARLARIGLRVVGHKLEPSAVGAPVEVSRHRTALTRYSLSTPVQALWRHGYLDGTHSFFDYGCGRGDDLRALQAIGLEASGWDPHFAAESEKQAADVVNLGFVLNVIEDQRERLEALRGAWSLTGRVLAVAVLIGGRSAFERFRLYRDGVLTARGTFQKYFTPAELREYLEQALGREPVTVAPGIAFIFRNDEDEQSFLARRARARATLVPRISPPPEREPRPRPPREPRAREPRALRERTPTKWELHSNLIDDFWATCLALGRLPEPGEYERLSELRDALGQPGTVFRTIVRRYGEDAFRAAQQSRRNDLLVFLALNVFERRRSFRGLPDSVQRDIRVHFGGYQNAQAQAQDLLFSTGKPQVILEAVRYAGSKGIGFLDGEHSLQLHSSLAQELPPVLRVYVGCAARLYGDVETADLLKLHVHSGKVSIMSYDDFEGKPLPRLIERVKINLRRQQIEFFEYGTNEGNEQLLYLKSRFVRPGFPAYDEQLKFDQDLMALGRFSFEGFGPPYAEFHQGLATLNTTIDGFMLKRR